MRNVMGQAVRSKKQEEEEKRWRTEEDLRTLQRAAEIKGDKERMKACMEMQAKQQKGMKEIGAAPKGDE